MHCVCNNRLFSHPDIVVPPWAGLITTNQPTNKNTNRPAGVYFKPSAALLYNRARVIFFRIKKEPLNHPSISLHGLAHSVRTFTIAPLDRVFALEIVDINLLVLAVSAISGIYFLHLPVPVYVTHSQCRAL